MGHIQEYITRSEEMRFAPVGLSVYSRLSHVRRTVAALKENTLARESDLYIFSDAPAPGDEIRVDEVRAYLKTIVGFKEIEIIERNENSRVANNRGGMRQLLDLYGRLIWLEEDIVTAPGFLAYMNSALNYYESDSNVFSISGYSPPLGLEPAEDVFALRRFCAWGFAMTRANFERIQAVPLEALPAIDKEKLSKYGEDIYGMLCEDASGKIDALDVKAMYHQYLTGKLTVYPRYSLVQNIGCDGTGIHCGNTSKFTHAKLWDKVDNFKYIEAIEPEVSMVAANQIFRKSKQYTGLKGCYKKSRFRKLWKSLK